MFLDLAGIGIIVPVLAPLIIDPSHGITTGFTQHGREMLLGALTMVFPLMQFFASPILGALADRYGRRPILILSLAGTVLGYLLFGLGVITHQIWLLFLSRAIDGFTGGNISVAQAAIADVSTPETKQRNFGLIGMAFGVGFVIGPFLGGILSDSRLVSWFSFDTPFWAAAIFSLLSLVMVWRVLPETIRERVHRPVTWLTGPRNVIRAFSFPNLRTLFTVMFLNVLGFAFYVQFFQVLLIERFGLTQSQIGLYFAYVGLWSALVQGVLTRFIAKRFKPQQSLKLSLLLVACGLLVSALAPKLWILYVISVPIISIGQGANMPALMTLLSNSGGADSQGEVMGIGQSVQALGSVVPPLIAGALLVFGPNVPALVGVGCVLLGWAVFFFLYGKNQNTPVFHEE